MTQPNQKPTANHPGDERGHSDPPGLWATIVLSSLVIHLFAFGMLRLWIMVRLNNFQAARNFIPIDVIAVASEGQILLPPTPATTSTSTQNLPSVNTPTNPVPNRQASSTSISNNSPSVRDKPASVTTNPSPSPKVPIATNSPTTKSAQNQSKEAATPSVSPTPNSSPNQPSGTQQTPSTNPNSSGNQGNQANVSTPSASPSPAPSTSSPTEQNSSNSKPSGGFIVALGKLELVSNTQEVLDIKNNRDKLATCLADSNPLPSDYLTSLGITLDKALTLKVEVLIDNLGKATLLRLPPQSLPQNLSAPQAEQLAKKLVEQQQCTATEMAGQPVYRDYSLTLTISPTQN